VISRQPNYVHAPSGHVGCMLALAATSSTVRVQFC